MRSDHGSRDGPRSPARRTFFKRLVARNQVSPSLQSRPAADKKPWLRLEDLPALPESALGRIKPGPTNQLRLTESRGWLEIRRAGDVMPAVSFSAASPESFLLQRFSGRATLAELARALAEATGLTQMRAFALARSVFLEMVQKGLFVPRNDVN